LYLSSYLVIASVGALARRAERDTDADTSWEWDLDERTMEEWSFASFCVMAVMQAGVWVWCVRALLLPVWDMKAKEYMILYVVLELPVSMMLGLLAGVPTAIASIPLSATYLIPTTLGKIAYVVCSASLMGLCMYSGPHLFNFLLPVHYPLYSVYVLLAAFFATKVVPRHLLMIFFALVNLVLSNLYYRFRYDPTGTVKPLWAEELG